MPQPYPRTLPVDHTTKQWCMFLHLSILTGYVFPLVGLLAPVVIWQVKKEQMPAIDEHGRNAVNWILSSLIYALVSVILSFVLIGIPMLIALGVCAVLFPLIAGLKASNGELWDYPLAIRFF